MRQQVRPTKPMQGYPFNPVFAGIPSLETMVEWTWAKVHLDSLQPKGGIGYHDADEGCISENVQSPREGGKETTL